MNSSVINKLKIEKHEKVLILNSPSEFLDLLKESTSCEVETELAGKYSYIQIFITSQAEILEKSEKLAEAIEGDGFLWICYPKGTSKKYKKVDCNRDTLRECMSQFGFEGVSLISIDDDWSAMRLRNSNYIKK